jgi:class 3 adenylate cyclase
VNNWQLRRGDVAFLDRQTLLVMSVTAKLRDGNSPPPEMATAIMRHHRNLCAEIIQRCGGTVVQEVSTGRALRFDDPDIAVRTAIDLEEQSDAWAGAWDDYKISVEIVLDSANALAAQGNFVSLSLNRAATLLQFSQPGQILCTAPVQAASLHRDLFRPESYMEMPGGMPAVFSVPWQKQRTGEDNRTLEYSHIGSSADDFAAARKEQALENWINSNVSKDIRN